MQYDQYEQKKSSTEMYEDLQDMMNRWPTMPVDEYIRWENEIRDAIEEENKLAEEGKKDDTAET